MVAALFILFDVEAVFLFAWAVVYKDIRITSYNVCYTKLLRSLLYIVTCVSVLNYHYSTHSLLSDYKPSFIGQAFLKIANGKLPALIPGGFDWVDVRDIAEGAVNAISYNFV